ncbi:class I SAM-dependent methyltransferase [Aquella oligotrophica]|uniref:Methyltransferase domain-containing protein n=1 Tax=Aquella oligotrophica TaxID=2067065 RepID=A0A2I7N2S0_9NEIS|nr:class I SAM-dependent methyltransferase [Aquella oligotrophica]AUR50744.1 hypothetical protein CUN60_00015 [Aquella oligotrophica]
MLRTKISKLFTLLQKLTLIIKIILVNFRTVILIKDEELEELLSRSLTSFDTNAKEIDKYNAMEALSKIIYSKYKFSEFGRLFLEDQEYLNDYAKLMDSHNWHSLDRKYVLKNLLNLISHIDGDLAECGVYTGQSAYFLCKYFTKAQKMIHLFDSFEGLSSPSGKDGVYWTKGDMKISEDMVKNNLAEFDNFITYKGWIPSRFNEVGNLKFCFIHLDVDLYQPTLDALIFFYPRLVVTGIILFDDYGFNSCPGAKAAVDFFLQDKPERIVMLPTGQAFIIKQHNNLLEVIDSENVSKDYFNVPKYIEWDNLLVNKFWDGVARTTLSELSFSRQSGANLAVILKYFINPNNKILDFGAGNGDLLRVLCSKNHDAEFYAYEPSPERALLLKKNLSEYTNFNGIAEQNQKFDIILMIEVIEHILENDFDTVINSVLELLKPHGKLIITTPNNEDLNGNMCYCPSCNSIFHRWQHVRSFNPVTLKNTMQKFGLQEIVTHQLDFADNTFFSSLSSGSTSLVIDFLDKLTNNVPIYQGYGSNLVYVGYKKED